MFTFVAGLALRTQSATLACQTCLFMCNKFEIIKTLSTLHLLKWNQFKNNIFCRKWNCKSSESPNNHFFTLFAQFHCPKMSQLMNLLIKLSDESHSLLTTVVRNLNQDEPGPEDNEPSNDELLWLMN